MQVHANTYGYIAGAIILILFAGLTAAFYSVLELIHRFDICEKLRLKK